MRILVQAHVEIGWRAARQEPLMMVALSSGKEGNVFLLVKGGLRRSGVPLRPREGL